MHVARSFGWLFAVAIGLTFSSVSFAAEKKPTPVVHSRLEIEEALTTRGEHLYEQVQELLQLRGEGQSENAATGSQEPTRKSFARFDEQAEVIKETCELLRIHDGQCDTIFQSGKPLATLAALAETLKQSMETCKRIAITDRRQATELRLALLVISKEATGYAEWADQWDGKIGNLNIEFLSEEASSKGKNSAASASVFDDPGAVIRRLRAWDAEHEDLAADENVNEDESVEPHSEAAADAFPLRPKSKRKDSSTGEAREN
jgi:hypothetical protein